LKGIINDAPSIVDYYVEAVIGRRYSFEERGEAAVRAATFITGIEDVIDRNLFIKRVSEKLGIDQDILKNEVHRRLNPKAQKDVLPSRRLKEETLSGLELNLIHLMMECPEVIPALGSSKVMEYFLNKDLKSIGQFWMDCALKESMNPGDAISFIQRIDNPGVEEILLKLLVQESPFQKGRLGSITADMIRQVKRRWYKEQHKNIKDRLLNAQASGDQALGRELLKEKERLIREEKESVELARLN